MGIVSRSAGKGLFSSSHLFESDDLLEGNDTSLVCLSFDFIDGKIPFEQFVQRLVEILPFSFSDPFNVCACLDIRGIHYISQNFKRTGISLCHSIYLNNEFIGVLSVYRSDELSDLGAWLFSKEEESIFKRIVDHVEMMLTYRKIYTPSFEKDESYHFFIENIKDVVYSIDSDMNLLYISPQVSSCGYAPEQLLSKNWLDIVHPDDREWLIDRYHTTIRQELSKPTVFRVFDSEGLIHWIEDVGKPIIAPSGEVTGINGILRDVTETKKVEQELESYRLELEEKVRERTEELSRVNEQLEAEISERNLVECLMSEHELLLENVLESSGDSIAFFDLDNKAKLMNSHFLAMWNIPEGPGNDMDYLDIFTDFVLPQLEDAENVASNIRDFLNRKEKDSGSLYLKDGRVIGYDLFPVFKEGTILGYVCNCRDMTIHKKAESELKKYAKDLEHSNELKDLFADILRHDLLNPAGISKGFLNVLMQKEEDPYMLDMLKKVEMSNQKLIDMIGMAAKLSRLDSDEDLEFNVIDLGFMVNIAKTNFGPMFENKDMRIECLFSGNYPAKANIMIEEVFANLLSNAIKYSPEGSTVYVDIFDVGDEWKVQFTDFGEGIPDEDKEFIFERFKRANKASIKGNGLGLAIVRKIIDLHGGSFGVEDNPCGSGCVFWVTLKKG